MKLLMEDMVKLDVHTEITEIFDAIELLLPENAQHQRIID